MAHILVMLDWDGTVTENSTLDLIAAIKQTSDRPKFEHFTEAWTADYTRHQDSYTPRAEDRHTVEQELAWLNSLRSVEEASIRRLEDSGIWHGVLGPELQADGSGMARRASVKDLGNVQDAAVRAVTEGQISFRNGFEAFLRRIMPFHNVAPAIISVSWSGIWISRAIRAQLGKYHGRSYYQEACSVKEYSRQFYHEDDLLVYANELDPFGTGTVSRRLPSDHSRTEEQAKDDEDFRFNFRRRGSGLWTAGDKAQVFDRAVADSQTSVSHRLSGAGVPFIRTVYIGDSTTDLACLLKADVGICIRPENPSSTAKELEETLQRIEIRCDDLRGAKVLDSLLATSSSDDQVRKKTMASDLQPLKRLWHAPDFQVIGDTLFPSQLDDVE